MRVGIRWLITALIALVLNGCSPNRSDRPAPTPSTLSVDISVRAPSAESDGPPLFVVRRLGGIAGMRSELRWFDDDVELRRHFDNELAGFKDVYPNPGSMDTFEYELEYDGRVIRWNEVNPEVPPFLRQLEQWFRA